MAQRSAVQIGAVERGVAADVADRDAADKNSVGPMRLERGAAIGEALLHLLRREPVAAEVVEALEAAQRVREQLRIVPQAGLVHRLDQIVRIQSPFFQLRPNRQPVVELPVRRGELLVPWIVHENHHFPVDSTGVGVVFVRCDELAEMFDQIRVVVREVVNAQRDPEGRPLRIAEKTPNRAVGGRIDHVHTETVHPVGERRFDLLAGAVENAGIPLEVSAEQRAIPERRQHPLPRRTHRQIAAVGLVEAPGDVVRPAHLLSPGIVRRRQYGQQPDQTD